MNTSNAPSLPWTVLLIASAMLSASCDACKPSNTRYHAVGTYVGGGSMLFGADECTYAGGPSVFQTSGPRGEAKKGPRFVFAPGKIVQRCKETMFDVEALAPTNAVITGPKKIKRGAENNERFSGHFVANDRELEGQGQIEWALGRSARKVLGVDDPRCRLRARRHRARGVRRFDSEISRSLHGLRKSSGAMDG